MLQSRGVRRRAFWAERAEGRGWALVNPSAFPGGPPPRCTHSAGRCFAPEILFRVCVLPARPQEGVSGCLCDFPPSCRDPGLIPSSTTSPSLVTSGEAPLLRQGLSPGSGWA